MKIQDLVFDVVVENFKSKSQFDSLVKKWYGENPTPEQIGMADKMLSLFMQKQKGLEPSNPAVYSFLTRFDGSYPNEFPIFDPKKLKDASQYTLAQMTSLYDDLRDDDVDEEGVFSGDNYSNLDKIKASYELWKGDEHKIIDEGNLRVYFIPNEKVSKQFGYYMQAVTEWDGSYLQRTSPEIFTKENKKLIPHVGTLSGAQWCVTGRGTSDSRGNLWGSYRDDRTFYFVIDESKAPSSDLDASISRYFISALQVDTGIRQGYRITSALNDGDNPKTWEEVIQIYPQLTEHKDKFVNVKFVRNNEMENANDVVGKINESLSNPYEFRRVNKKLKKAFLDRGGVLSKADSWRSMPDKLREYYILTTTARNVLDKYQSTEFMNEIKKKGSEFNLLNKRLKVVGLEGIGYIYDHLMKNEFDIARNSLDNQNIRLYQSKKTGKYGLYNVINATWITSDGITYEPTYDQLEDTSLYQDNDGNLYLVEIFSESGEPTPTSLYCIYPVSDENVNVKGHFITSPKFESLKQKIQPTDDDSDVVNISDFNPETDVDIKEMKKGL